MESLTYLLSRIKGLKHCLYYVTNIIYFPREVLCWIGVPKPHEEELKSNTIQITWNINGCPPTTTWTKFYTTFDHLEWSILDIFIHTTICPQFLMTPRYSLIKFLFIYVLFKVPWVLQYRTLGMASVYIVLLHSMYCCGTAASDDDQNRRWSH